MTLFKDLTKKQQEIAKRRGYAEWFGDRNSVTDAYNYGLEIAKSCVDHATGVITAIQVLVNTYSVQNAVTESKYSNLLAASKWALQWFEDYEGAHKDKCANEIDWLKQTISEIEEE